METYQFYIRHQTNFLRDKMILVFKSNEARDFFKQAIKGSHFEKITSQEAEYAVRIGIHGKVIPYGYTIKLTDDEIDQLSTADWETTAAILAEGNERFYHEAMKTKKK